MAHRTTDTNRVVDKFGVGKDGFTEGDKATGVPATKPGDEFFDMAQEEICRTVEAAGITLSTPGGDYAQLREAIRRIGGFIDGARTGLFSRTSNSQITLSPVSGEEVKVEVDGILYEASSLVWDNTTDLDTGSVASNTIYYLYALVTGGALDTKISTTAPATSVKVGYHPTRTSERCIFAMRTKSGSAVWAGFDEQPDGWTILRSGEFSYTDLGTSEPTSYAAAVSLSTVPATARAVRLSVAVEADDIVVNYAHESLAGSLVSSFPGMARAGGVTNSTTNAMTDSSVFDLPCDSTPAFTWGVEQIGGTNNINTNRYAAIGWRNAL